MSVKLINCLSVTLTMSLLSSAIFLILLLISTAKSTSSKDGKPTPSVQNFKEFVTSMIKDQSSKIQTLLKKIQINAQTVLTKIENMKQDSKNMKKNLSISPFRPLDFLNNNIQYEERQVESPLKKNMDLAETSTEPAAEARSFNTHYGTTSYGVSANANYGHLPTYHHHSIGFDPINIVVSMSLLSFILQALQGLLNRTRLPTAVVEARNLNPVQEWIKKFEEKNSKAEYLKRRYPKKF